MRINEFPLGTITDEDLLLFWDTETNSTKAIKASELKAYIGVATTPTPIEKTLTYQSNGDTNGVFYYFGTNKNTQPWSNPASKIFFTASSVLAGRTPNRLADRAITEITNDAHTDTELNAWFKVDLGTANSLIINHYTLQARNTSDQQPRSWKLQGSKDDITYIDLDNQSKNPILINGSFYSKSITNQVEGYRYFKLTQTGINSSNANYFVLGEWELYGKLIHA